MDFREVTAALHGSTVQTHTIDLSQSRVELTPDGGSAILFENVTLLKWSGAGAGPATIHITAIGLERLGAEQPWRLYLKSENEGELELTCGRVICGGGEVTGVGRSYRH